MKSKELSEMMDGVAVVGIALRFPGASNAEEFWRNLLAGTESVSNFTDEELLGAGVPPAALRQSNYVKAKGVIEGEDLFDAPFFGFTPREAAVTDPQQRIFLECAWQALEDAGYDPDQSRAAIGVFAGTAMSTYLFNLMTRRDIVETVGRYQLGIANDKDHLTTMASYKLNLRGPSINVQTSCSTSLVAVHLACQSLLGGECDMALAGGVTVKVPQKSGYFYQEGGITSPDGHCRAFDARAQGTVGGSGCGVVVLKRLEDALADGDVIHAVIRGSAINNDGAGKVGYTAPSVAGQAAAVREAIAIAGVEPDSIGYVEAHGTATPIGDPIEVLALSEAFGAEVARGSCALGSVKTNLGHLDTAAGVAGLIKAVLAVREGVVPPTLHFERPNPALRLSETPFFINTEPREWPRANGPRRAGVSSFGIGGTNAHVILEEPPAVEASELSRPLQILTVSARTESALGHACANLAAHLRRHADLNLADVAYTLRAGRRAFKYRRAVVCHDLPEAAVALESHAAAGVAPEGGRRVAFMFPGQGAQSIGMGLGLYRAEEVFRRQLDECAEMLRGPLGVDLRDTLYPREATEEAARRLTETVFTQPALFAVEYATARLLMSWGVRPSAMIGHSIGELVAACLAGVLSLEDALGLVAARSRLMQEMPAGAMLAVGLGEEDAKLLVEGRPLSLAAINGARQCVVSGEESAVVALEEELRGRGAAHRRLQTSHAFHSPMMRPAAERFAELVARVRLKPPQTPYASNITGRWIEASEATSPAYWAEHLCAPVRFDEGLRLLCATGDALLEVGPGRALCNLAREVTARDEKRPPIVETLGAAREPEGEARGVLEALGTLWANGAKVAWSELHAGERRRRVSLPTYPFERQRHWIEPLATQAESSSTESGEERARAAATHTDAPAAPGEQETQAMSANNNGRARTPRQERLLEGLKGIINELTGVDVAEVDPHATYFEMGVSSLLLIQATRAIEQRYGVKLALAQFFDELKTLDILAAYLDGRMPPEEPEPAVSVVPQVTVPAPAPPVQAPPAFASTPAGAIPSQGSLEYVVSQQLALMAQQLELLRAGSPTVVATVDAVANDKGVQADGTSSNGARAAAPQPAQAPRRVEETAASKQEGARQEAYVPFQQAEIGPAGGLSDVQQRHLDELVARYTKRTRRSKELTQQHRRVLADPRTTAGYRRLWKEMLYPLVVERSQGARLWDVDGNEYIDLTMGFGVHMFGHSPDFIREALATQVGHGIHLGPQSNLAGEVASLISELTGVERVTFSNSGTEAVMAALRVARSVTGRSKVAFFVGSYHGTFDGILARSGYARGERRTVAMAPGVMPGMVEDVIVLDYGSEESLEIIGRMKDELAAVLVEPVQSRRPDFQPAEYLRELRRLTEEGGAALIFDEVVTGFRVHPGGCQALFDIRADLVTYGKVIGGGLPIGVLAGRADYMDAIDGGYWQFGDDSYPAASKTFFSGTFCKHPLTMATAHAALRHMKQAGPVLQETLNARASRLTATLNEYFGREELAFRVSNFGSLISFSPPRELRHAELFSYHLVEKGVYVWEGSTRYLSTAHTDEDVEFITRAVRESVAELRDGGFIAGAEPRTRAVPGAAAAASEPEAQTTRTAPLTEAQKQLWLMAQMGPEASRAYNESNSVRLRGTLDVRAMTAAVQRLVARHEALRTNFSAEGDRQIVHPSLSIDVPFVDLSALDSEERERRLRGLKDELGSRIFDLTCDPLLRVQIVKLEEQLYQLVLVFHHIAVDGWSSGVMLSELRAFYEAECRGRSCELPPPASLSEHARAEAAAHDDPRRLAADSYWLEQFAQVPPPLELPADWPRPLSKSFKGARARAVFDATLTRDLKQLSARQGCTLMMTLLAGYQLLLHRLSGQDEVVVGVAAAGQFTQAEAPIFGHFVNLLPLRGRATGDPTFAEYLRAVRGVALAGFEHQNFSFTGLVGKLNLPRDPARTPLFGAVFNFGQARAGAAIGFHELEAEVEANETGMAKFDIYLNIIEKGGELHLDFEYDSDLFRPETARRWLGHLRRLLRGVADAPDQRLSSVPMLEDEELHQLLVGWNPAPTPYPIDRCMHELFEERAAEMPDAVAVVCNGRNLSYGELNRRSNRLARRLRALGIGPEVLVGVMMERSEQLLVALLGVLKAGGAYVPIDLAYPPERVSFMLEDSGATVLLTESALAERLGGVTARAIYLDTEAEEIAKQSAELFESGVQSQNLAYLIYTSGSTGRPKGVAIQHRNAVAFLYWAREHFGADALARVLASTSISFDISIFELFATLGWGGRVVLAQNALELPALAASEELTLLNTVPSAMAELVRMGGLPRSVRVVNLAGEPLAQHLVEQVYLNENVEQVWNLYGPSEDTTYSTAALVRGGAERGPTIGRPVANTRIYVLDGGMKPVVPGVVGEVYIGGAGLARGYYRRPALTAERFVPDPLSKEPGGRLYRTGDLARHLPDGELDFLGRIDHQVKIRGYRIELGEIETALRDLPFMRDCVVVAREESDGHRRLAAYVVTQDGGELDTAEVREKLRKRLPEFMIPAHFVRLEALPLTPNGKVDRRALPAPEQMRAEPAGQYLAPRTPEEETLASIWAEVLRRENVGVRDNFFELGGDSILSIQIVSRATRAGLRLTPGDIFRHQTVAELAAVALPQGTAQAEQGPVTGPVTLTPIQRWFFEQENPNPHHFNQSMLFEVRRPIDPAVVGRAVGHWLAHHDALRLRFERDESGWRQFNEGPEVDAPFELVDLSTLEESEQRAAVEAKAADAQASLDLTAGPLARVVLFDLGAGRAGRLLVVIHHLAIDGVSWRVLLEDLQTACAQLERGEQVRLPSKTTSFQSWAARLDEFAQSATLREESDFWLELAQTKTNGLPADFEGGVNSKETARTVSVLLDEEETRSLLHDVPAAYRTEINDALLTALASAFERVTGTSSLLVDVEGHGREELFEDVDLTRTVGWFTSLFPVLLDTVGASGPGERLRAVKEQTRRVPRRGVGYGLLRYLCRDDETARAMRSLPRATVSFNYLGQFDQVLPGSSPFAAAPESVGLTRDPRGARSHLVEVTGFVAGGRLRVNWTYGERIHRQETIESVADAFLAALREIIARPDAREEKAYAPSDFAEFEWDGDELEEIVATISETAREGRA